MTENNTKFLHFTLGPVQGFVSQARRTRDFWAGSFLLSYLSATAMRYVEEGKGRIIFPNIDDDGLIKRLRSGAGSPIVGSVPNRFVAGVPDALKGENVAKAVTDEWKRIADKVWEHDLERIATQKQKQLWDSQIDEFWEIAWVITEDAEATSILDRRKNWRNHYPPVQYGDKCTVMGEWQELSCVPSPGRKEQKTFWEEVRKDNGLDFRDGERLSAISYVKRRFVHVWRDLHRGWELPTAVPSTSYMAGVHWIEQVLKFAADNDIDDFLAAARGATEGYGEWRTSIQCIDNAITEHGKKKFSSLDGRVFFRSALENHREFDPKKAEPVLDALSALANTVIDGDEVLKERKIGEPSPFYAILMMDGDSLGKDMSKRENQAAISNALAAFTQTVPKAVIDNNGFLIYAGGDDVLAILPLEDAIPCALNIRSKWKAAFKDSPGMLNEKSISAGIVYAHMKLPLTQILKDTHRLLEDVAKEETGRDALAVRVWKPAGTQLTWSAKWEGNENGTVDGLRTLVNDFKTDEEGEPGYASKPLYRIRERLTGARGMDEGTVRQLLVAEYATSGVLKKEDSQKKTAENRIDRLLPFCRTQDGGFGAEAAMLVRFLAQKGVGK